MGISPLAASERRDRFIPVRKEDLLGALVQQGDFADTEELELFRRFARTLRAICHYESSETLDRLRDDYYYFSPEVAGRATVDRAKSDSAYDDLLRSLDKVLKDANFEELTHDDITEAHRGRTLSIAVKAVHDDFRDVRFYRRGRHVEKQEVSEWFGLRRHEVESEVFDDVVLLVAIKPQTGIASQRELRFLKRRKIVPGSVLLKYFRNIAFGDLYALYPNARVVMSNFDKTFLSVPAIAGGIPILLKLYATISVLFLVAGVYLGGSGSVADADMKTALAALLGLVALGGFLTHQWVKYQHRSLRHHVDLAANIYYRNISNNAGIFDYLIATAEDQECKEALLAYHFIRKSGAAPTAAETRMGIEAWLAKSFDVKLNFEIAHALDVLDRFGLMRRQAEKLHVLPLGPAIARLHDVWNSFFPNAQAVESS